MQWQCNMATFTHMYSDSDIQSLTSISALHTMVTVKLLQAELAIVEVILIIINRRDGNGHGCCLCNYIYSEVMEVWGGVV